MEADSGVSVATDAITFKDTVNVPENTVSYVMSDPTGEIVESSSAMSEEEISRAVTLTGCETTKYESTAVPAMTVKGASHRFGHFGTRTLVKRSRNRKDFKSRRPTLRVLQVPRFIRPSKNSKRALKGSRSSQRGPKGSPTAPKTPKTPKWQSWPKWDERHPMINTPAYYNETRYNDTHHGDTRYNLTVSVSNLWNQTWHNVTGNSPQIAPRWTNSSGPTVAVHVPISPDSSIAIYPFQGGGKSLRNSSYGFSQNQTESKPNRTESCPLPAAPTLRRKPLPTFEIADDHWEGTTPNGDENDGESDDESDGEYDSDEDEGEF